MKDYQVTFRVKNNYMLTAMQNMGIETAAQLSRATGVPQVTIGQYLNLKEIPFKTDGKLKLAIKKLSVFFKMLPEDLFPPQHLVDPLKANTATAELSLSEIQPLLEYNNPESLLEIKERDNKIQIVLDTLSDREQKILKDRHGFLGEAKTLKECGEEFGITVERCRQIEKKALRKLRHPTRSGEIRDFY